MSIEYVIINDSFQMTGKSGYIYKDSYFSNLKYQISQSASIPVDAIKNLYSSILGDCYNIYNYNSNSRIYAMVYDAYTYFSNGISSLIDKNRTLSEENSRNLSKIEELRTENSYNQSRINDLSRENSDNRRRIDELNQKNENLNRKLQEEENLRKEEKEKFNKFKNDFEEIKKSIENKHIKISENYINKFIVNKFIKEFETKDGKKNPFTLSLTDYMEKFNEDFIFYCQKFLSSFKANSQKIVNDFNINDNNILIEHINFIVIGKAGVGKSSFINESLSLPKEKRAKEGIGKSITNKSMLYSSDKLKMIRMWDTQGLDYKISQEYILNEVKRIVEDGLNKGPDHYINIILYCTTGERFQDEDGQLIYEIMKLYPSDNLPVIITQLQAYFIDRVKEMEKTIRNILSNYLENKIAEKIEIRDVIARDQKGGKEVFKARGIPELLRLSVDLMGRAITSATCKKFSEEIEKLCKNFIDNKINFIQEQFKYEMEILELNKSYYVEDIDDIFENQEEKQKKELSEDNIYKKIDNKTYFENNFIQIMAEKYINIFNYLNDENYEVKNMENIKEESQENKANDANGDKPLILFFIEDRLPKLKQIINNSSKKIFEKVFKIKFQDYLSDLQKEQSLKNKEFNVNYQILEIAELEEKFKEKLFQYFNNEFFKNVFCIILKLFMTNLKNALINYYKKELKENEMMIEIINKKAEDSLKYITQKLNENLLKELNDNFSEKNGNEQEKEAKNEFNEINFDDMNFNY